MEPRTPRFFVMTMIAAISVAAMISAAYFLRKDMSPVQNTRFELAIGLGKAMRYDEAIAIALEIARNGDAAAVAEAAVLLVAIYGTGERFDAVRYSIWANHRQCPKCKLGAAEWVLSLSLQADNQPRLGTSKNLAVEIQALQRMARYLGYKPAIAACLASSAPACSEPEGKPFWEQLLTELP